MNQKGFSILELLTVIGVISIVAGIGIPAINNFGVSENYQSDVAAIRSQFNYVRQLAIENGNAYRIKIVNNISKTTATLEVYRDESLNRFNTNFHKNSSPPCSQFSETGNTGVQINDITKQLDHITISKCSSLTGNCTAVSAINNFFCILPDASGPENARAEIQASNNAGAKIDALNVYESGFFNIGERIQ
jgi:prepilin-type N-terminal cleavage/methylation domain-containing protein